MEISFHKVKAIRIEETREFVPNPLTDYDRYFVARYIIIEDDEGEHKISVMSDAGLNLELLKAKGRGCMNYGKYLYPPLISRVEEGSHASMAEA